MMIFKNEHSVDTVRDTLFKSIKKRLKGTNTAFNYVADIKAFQSKFLFKLKVKFSKRNPKTEKLHTTI